MSKDNNRNIGLTKEIDQQDPLYISPLYLCCNYVKTSSLPVLSLCENITEKVFKLNVGFPPLNHAFLFTVISQKRITSFYR